jgi:hypothetical protein
MQDHSPLILTAVLPTATPDGDAVIAKKYHQGRDAPGDVRVEYEEFEAYADPIEVVKGDTSQIL